MNWVITISDNHLLPVQWHLNLHTKFYFKRINLKRSAKWWLLLFILNELNTPITIEAHSFNGSTSNPDYWAVFSWPGQVLGPIRLIHTTNKVSLALELGGQQSVYLEVARINLQCFSNHNRPFLSCPADTMQHIALSFPILLCVV